MHVKDTLVTALSRAVARAQAEGALDTPESLAIQLDVPPSPDLGDYASEVAVILARQSGRPPAVLAQVIVDRMELPAGLVDRIGVASSGFLNFHLRPDWLHGLARSICAQGAGYGRMSPPGVGEKVLVEFVSAPPTGPLTVTHGRGAALGDALASLLEWTGARVCREFYVNDTGSHMERFGRALEAHYLQALGVREAPLPVDAFDAPHLAALARDLARETEGDCRNLPAPERAARLGRAGRDSIVRRQRDLLERFGVRMDSWQFESELHEGGRLDAVLQLLRERGRLYESEDVLWLRTADLGDTEDRPLVRSNGRPTYLAGDVAYHHEKFARGFHRVVDLWGPDHALYAPRTRAGMRALGHAPEALEILIFGPVSLRIEGLVRDSGSALGNMPLLEDVLEQVGPAATRLLFLAGPLGAPLELDLDLAREGTETSLVSQVRQATESADRMRSAAGQPIASEVDLTLLDGLGAASLLRKLADFPEEVASAAREREPYRLVRYARALAAGLAAAEEECTGGAGDAMRACAVLASAAEITLLNALEALGIPAARPGS